MEERKNPTKEDVDMNMLRAIRSIGSDSLNIMPWRSNIPKGETKQLLLVTHADDADGIGCELIVRRRASDLGVIPTVARSHISDLPKILERELVNSESEYDYVVISDIGYNPECYQMLNTWENKSRDRYAQAHWYWLDHHQIPEHADGYDEGDDHFLIYPSDYVQYSMPSHMVFGTDLHPKRTDRGRVGVSCDNQFTTGRMKVSGAWIMNLWFWKNERIDDPDLAFVANAISLGDTYSFKDLLPTYDTARFENYIGDWPALLFKEFGAEKFLRVMNQAIDRHCANHFDEGWKTLGMIVDALDHQRNIGYHVFKGASKKILFQNMFGYNKLLVVVADYHNPNFSSYANRMLDEIGKFDEDEGTNCLKMAIVLEITKFLPKDAEELTGMVSLRSSTHNGPDVSQICREYFSGGGHIHAAGGRCALSFVDEVWAIPDGFVYDGETSKVVPNVKLYMPVP